MYEINYIFQVLLTLFWNIAILEQRELLTTYFDRSANSEKRV
jgi:hypothetical protein